MNSSGVSGSGERLTGSDSELKEGNEASRAIAVGIGGRIGSAGRVKSETAGKMSDNNVD